MENRPQTKQRSRKGKKAWRKNVDIDDVEQGLDQKSEHERVFGRHAGDGFVLDTEGDVQLGQPKHKKLKSTEILNKRSQFPALQVERRKKIQGVAARDVGRLMKLSGRMQGTTAAQARLLEDGVTNTPVNDLWGQELLRAAAKAAATPEVLQRLSYTEWTAPKRAPKTLRQAPLATRTPAATISLGKLYNPSFDLWKALLNEEYEKEKSNEDKRVLLQQHQEKIKYLIANLGDNEEADSESEAEADEEEEEEEQTESGLSVNKPTEVKIKTRTKRNRERAHRQREELQLRLAELKLQIHQLEKLALFEAEVTHKLLHTRTKRARVPRKLFKHAGLEPQLEIKLLDEILDSLRKLRPEGNLLHDEMRKLQHAGKVEARVPVPKRRKYAPKITEKWSYKDFK